jgi:hypothetical protein
MQRAFQIQILHGVCIQNQVNWYYIEQLFVALDLGLKNQHIGPQIIVETDLQVQRQ